MVLHRLTTSIYKRALFVEVAITWSLLFFHQHQCRVTSSFSISSRQYFRPGVYSKSTSLVTQHMGSAADDGKVNGEILSQQQDKLNGDSESNSSFTPKKESTTTSTSNAENSKNKLSLPKDNDKVVKIDESKRRKMELSWCGRDSCTIFEDGLREKVVGDHNEIIFESPATGQVAYQWVNGQDLGVGNATLSSVTFSRVLILVKRNDDELLQVASEVSLTI